MILPLHFARELGISEDTIMLVGYVKIFELEAHSDRAKLHHGL
jgi:hypothetical protein